jgi:hypothetical protein
LETFGIMSLSNGEVVLSAFVLYQGYNFGSEI